MKTRTRIIPTVVLALCGLISAPLSAQSDLCEYERNRLDRNEYRHSSDFDSLSRRSSDRESFLTDWFRPQHRDDDMDFRRDQDRRSRRVQPVAWETDRSRYDRGLSDDLFRDLDRDRYERDLEQRDLERRYRIPLRDSRDGRSDLRDRRRFDDRRQNDRRFDQRRDQSRNEDRRRPGYDPLTPPLPRRDGGSSAEALTQRITARFQNPTTVRTMRSLSTDQALRLYREVSTQTDARHLEPSSYDLRVRRALRNLALTLENPTATRALGISGDSFRVDAFRDYLSRRWDNMNVQSRTDAERVMQEVMGQAQQVSGLTPGVVAYEFASSTVDTLDKFSALEPSEPRRGPSAALESEMVGIGVEIKEHEDGLLLMRALRGGPAAAAGLQSGDIITAIDRRRIDGMPIAQSVDYIKGRSGSQVELTFDRSGRSRTVTLTRRRFRVWSVNDVRMVDGTDVGYLNLSQFAQSSTQEVDQALQQLHRQGMKSLVLDLRGNPGGLLTTCVEITNRFLPCGTIVSTKGRRNSDNMHEAATFQRTWGLPLVVLVDGDSASASEILAAAIQDNERGIVVGEKSYGKGTVQTHFPLQSINGNLRLTTARFYAPSGRAMSGAGVTPDVRVEDRDGVANGDRVLEEALEIARSRQLKDMAVAAGRCRIKNGQPARSSFRSNMFDSLKPRTVLR